MVVDRGNAPEKFEKYALVVTGPEMELVSKREEGLFVSLRQGPTQGCFFFFFFSVRPMWLVLFQ